MDALGPQHLLKGPWVGLGQEAWELVQAAGIQGPGAAQSPWAGRGLCHPLPGPHLPAATATHPHPVSGLCCCLVHGRLPGGKRHKSFWCILPHTADGLEPGPQTPGLCGTASLPCAEQRLGLGEEGFPGHSPPPHTHSSHLLFRITQCTRPLHEEGHRHECVHGTVQTRAAHTLTPPEDARLPSSVRW